MVTSYIWGTTKTGEPITVYSIENAGIGCRVINFGAVLANLYVPDRSGERKDIILGFDRLSQYEVNKDYFGALIGPVANRTDKGRFTLNGTAYQLPINDGPNNLHTDPSLGLHKKIWKATTKENAVIFTCSVPDGECGLPGNRQFTVTYTITEDAALQIHYQAITDKPTYINPTNHAYFNLEGNDAGAGAVMETTMQLWGSRYTPVGAGSIPTGEIAPVEGTPLDFRIAEKIGARIDQDNEQLAIVGGYDHNYCIDAWTGNGSLVRAARAVSARSGRVMEVWTNLPGIQFYSGNYVDDPDGKQGHDYEKRAAFCLETQYYPDSVNHDNFPQPIFDQDKPYDSCTEYRFSAE